MNHRRRGFKNLLEAWAAYLMTYESVVADTQGTTASTRAKVNGLVKKFKCTVDVYLDLLEQLVPASMVFEADALMPYEISSGVTRSILQLREMEEEIGGEDEFLTALSPDNVAEDGVAKGEFVKAGDIKKKKENLEYVTVQFQFDAFNKAR